LVALLSFNVNTQFSSKDHDPCLWILIGLSGAICNIYFRQELKEADTINPVNK
jgi:hypothetical protein